MNNPYKTLHTKTVYQNPWIRVREDAIIHPDGNEGIYGVVESKDSVMAAVLNDKNEVYLIYTFSYPSQSWNWELPGGGGDGEEAVVASRRELMEETGIDAKQWDLLGTFRVCNGLLTERQAAYLARDITMTDTKKDAIDEVLVPQGKFCSFDEVHTMIERGEINDGQSLATLYLAEQWLARQS